MNQRHGGNTHPRTIAEILDDQMRFRRTTIQVVLRFKRSRPWRGSVAERQAKFLRFHRNLCRIYGKQTTLEFGALDGGCSDRSYYSPVEDAITLVGRLSVVTYLHEFAHALGRNERGACRWSVNLFKQCFPRQFARCRAEGHMLRRGRPMDG